MRALRGVSRFGRAIEVSVRDVSSVSRSVGGMGLDEKGVETLEKVDSYLEILDRLKGYLAFYGIKM